MILGQGVVALRKHFSTLVAFLKLGHCFSCCCDQTAISRKGYCGPQSEEMQSVMEGRYGGRGMRQLCTLYKPSGSRVDRKQCQMLTSGPL